MPSITSRSLVLSLSLIASLASAVPTPEPMPIELPIKWARRLDRRQEVETNVSYPLTVLEPVVEVGVGSPPQRFTLIFDTGSADTWMPAKNCNADDGCVSGRTFDSALSSTSRPLNTPFVARYGSENVTGTYLEDTVTFGENIQLKEQTVVAVNHTRGQLALQSPDEALVIDGILGAGFPGLMVANMVSSLNKTTDSTKTMTPVPIELYERKLISEPLFSVYMGDMGGSSGSIVFGGVHKFAGEAHTAPVVRSKTFNGDDSQYYQWRIHVNQMSRVGGAAGSNSSSSNDERVVLEFPDSQHSFHVDTGTPISRLPAKEVEQLAVSLFGKDSVSRKETGVYHISKCSTLTNDNTPYLAISVPDTSNNNFNLNLYADDLLLPADREQDICLFIFGEGNDYMIGNIIMHKYITVFNFGDKTVTFADFAD